MEDNSGKKVTAVLVGGDPDHHGVLNQNIANLWASLSRQHFDWDILSDNEKKRFLRLNGCLNKLSACLLQCRRLTNHYEWLMNEAKRNAVDKLPKNVDEAHLAYAGVDACSDFESLLLQGCASLDRLAYFLSSEFKNPTTRYRRLGNVLKNFSKTDKKAEQLKEIHNISQSWVDGILTIFDSQEAFRDLVAHKESASERMNSCFAITCMNNREVLVYDCEVGGLGIYKTAHDAAVHLPFLILNSLAIIFDISPMNEIRHFAIPWQNQTALLRDFAIDEPENSRLKPKEVTIVRRMLPSGVQIMTKNVDPELFNFVLKFSD